MHFHSLKSSISLRELTATMVKSEESDFTRIHLTYNFSFLKEVWIFSFPTLAKLRYQNGQKAILKIGRGHISSVHDYCEFNDVHPQSDSKIVIWDLAEMTSRNTMTMLSGHLRRLTNRNSSLDDKNHLWVVWNINEECVGFIKVRPGNQFL